MTNTRLYTDARHLQLLGIPADTIGPLQTYLDALNAEQLRVAVHQYPHLFGHDRPRDFVPEAATVADLAEYFDVDPGATGAGKYLQVVRMRTVHGTADQFLPDSVHAVVVKATPNGVVDILVENEAEAVHAAKHYLSMFQGRVEHWSAPDPLLLRQVVPENRLRVYDTRKAIEGIADIGSVLMLRSGFGQGIHTALARVEGQAVGMMANNPHHLGGAIDADAADKAARFMQLCDAHGLPIVSLIDTPGFMVGPEVEAQAQVRHVSRLFLAGAKLRVALLAVTLRKGYGLGAMAMAGGGFRSANLTVAWPTGEFGPMGLEGAIRLGFKKELEALPDGPQRKALYDQLVAQAYERGHAISTAAAVEIDAVIDPAHTRKWIAQGIASAGLHAQRPRRAFVDAW